MSYLLFDLGATNLRVAAVSEADWAKGELGEMRTVAHADSPRGTLGLFEQLMAELKPSDGWSAVAGGVTRHLAPLIPELTKTVSRPLYLENDAALAGLGEATVGVGQGRDLVAYVTVSTGVGGARIVDGRIDRKAVGFEPGHQIINFGGAAQTLESQISGRALLAKFGQLPREITDKKIWAETAKILAAGLYNMILHWSPETVVVGGAMALKRPGIDLELVREELTRINQVLPSLPEIVPAALGDLGGLHGASVYLRQQLEE